MGVFLKQPVTYAVFRPIGCQTCWFRFVEDLDWISSIMVNFDLSKACCRSSSLLSSSRKGSIVSVTYDDQTKPSICDSWEVGDSPDILLAWSHCVCRDFEASEFNLVLGKPKFLGVEGDA